MALFGPKSKEYGDLNRKSITEIDHQVEETKEEVKVIQSDPFSGSDPGLVPTSDETTQAKYLRGDGQWGTPAGGGGGTENYEDLANKPAIDGTTLDKNSTAEGLGLAKKTEIPTKTSDLDNDSGFLTSENDPTVPSWAKQPNPPTPATFDGEHAGLVPVPVSGDAGKYLKADGTWGTPSGGGASGFTPIGTIIAVYAETAPANYLACDGSTYNKADYPELAAHLLSLTDTTPYVVDGDSTKFKVPDLRGEFLRGTGTNSHSNQGNGSSVGIHQDATEHLIWRLNKDNNNAHFDEVDSPATSGIFNAQNVENYISSNTHKGNYVATTRYDNGDTEIKSRYNARPTNTSVLFCIATKNISTGGSYVLPTASAETLGGVKIGDGLSIDEQGVLKNESTVLTPLSGLMNVESDSDLKISHNGDIYTISGEVELTNELDIDGRVQIGQGSIPKSARSAVPFFPMAVTMTDANVTKFAIATLTIYPNGNIFINNNIADIKAKYLFVCCQYRKKDIY